MMAGAVVALAQAPGRCWSNSGERSSAIHTVGGAKKELMRCFGQQRQQVVGRGLGGDDVGGAHVHAGAEEHVELGAVVQRQRVQRVVLGDLGVHQAAHVLAITASCVSIAPLGRLSVPLV
jgi:hypothetical protein